MDMHIAHRNTNHTCTHVCTYTSCKGTHVDMLEHTCRLNTHGMHTIHVTYGNTGHTGHTCMIRRDMHAHTTHVNTTQHT